jgi:hypothetical protein
MSVNLKQMKKTILIIVCVGIISHIFAQKSFYEQVKEPDSILSVYLEKDTSIVYSIDSLRVCNKVYLVFENKSSDSIVLFSKFKHFSSVFQYVPGFFVDFYFNHRLVMPHWGEMRPDYFEFSNGKTPIPPYAKVKFGILLLRLFLT